MGPSLHSSSCSYSLAEGILGPLQLAEGVLGALQQQSQHLVLQQMALGPLQPQRSASTSSLGIATGQLCCGIPITQDHQGQCS